MQFYHKVTVFTLVLLRSVYDDVMSDFSSVMSDRVYESMNDAWQIHSHISRKAFSNLVYNSKQLYINLDINNLISTRNDTINDILKLILCCMCFVPLVMHFPTSFTTTSSVT